MNTDILKNKLTKIGLTESEATIYLQLVNGGIQTVKQIADSTDINRTTVYRHLESLVEKSLAEWLISKRGKKVQLTSPDRIQDIIRTKKKKIQKLEKSLPNLLTTLKKLEKKEKYKTQVRYYEGSEGIKQMIWNTLQAKNTLRSYSPFGRRDFVDPKWEDKFEAEWVRRELSDKIITNETSKTYIDNKLVNSYRETLQIKIIPSEKFYITSDITIYKNTVSIASFEKENLVGVEIENKEMAKTQKSIFDIVWEAAV